MRSRLLRFCVACLFLPGILGGAASRAAAAPTAYNLYWDDCSLGAARTDETHACDRDVGAPHKMVASLMPGEILGGMTVVQGLIRMVVDGPALPDWWRTDAGGCRYGQMTGDGLIGSELPPFSCASPWPAAVLGGAVFSPTPSLGPNRANIFWILAAPETILFDPGVAPEWYLIEINLRRNRTTTCSGCEIPACLVLNEVRMTRPAGDPRGDLFLSAPALSGYVTWQGGGAINCPGATPARDRTWGQLKGMYR